MHMYASISMGACSPGEVRCSEIASEAILGQKQSRSSYMACIVPLHIWTFAKSADIEFP